MHVMKYKIFLFYVLIVLLASLLVTLTFNKNQILIRNLGRNFGVYPLPTFFQIEEINLRHISRPPPNEIRQFRNDPSRLSIYDVEFNPDLLRPTKIKNVDVINNSAHTASKSSPIDSENFLILAGDYGLIQILNKKDLTLHWRLQLFDSDMGVHGTPITFLDYTFIGDYSGNVYFLDLRNKKILWIIDLGDALGATPYFDGKHLFANVELSNPANGYFIKLDPFRKEVIWRSALIGEQSHSSPAASSDSLFFGTNNGDFFRLLKEDGSTYWKKHLGSPIKSTPNLWKDLVIFSSWDKKLIALSVESGELIWQYPLPNTNQSSMAIDPDLGVGFINSSIGLHKVDLRSGKELALLKMEMGSGPRKASPVILRFGAKQQVAFPCKLTHLCFADSMSLNLIREFDMGGRVSNQVGILSNGLLVTTEQGGALILRTN